MVDHPGSSPHEYEQLARYWDAITAGHPADAVGLDLALVAVIEAFHRLTGHDDAQRPDPRFVHRLLEDLMATATTISPGFVSLNAVPTRSPNGRASAPALKPLPPRRVFWTGGALATAALVLLIFVGGLFAVGSHRLSFDEDAPVVMPAFVGSPEASPVLAVQNATPAVVTPLLRLTVTEPWPGNEGSAGLFRGTYAPDGYSRELSKGSPQLFFVETGAVTARLVAGEGAPVNLGSGAGSAPQLATPAGDNPMQIAAGEAGLLLTGTTVELRNEGSTPAAVLWLVSTSANRTTESSDVTLDLLIGGVQQAVPPPPMLISLDRVTLAPGATAAASATTMTKVGPVDARRRVT